ncbi:C6 transcription factor SndA [Penicillium alfredii]|uniref:C6 transcription factor SndA n=1 Tax=Penicillium alfredii TaxID=1506179 RepID=A0A9W9FT17_9EURO|nr:C6 transcription factor SndA [Penicillium alfredii]KAJ5105352.1 C6 transcription factor SndA [Penicillium alfredii]
MGDQGTMPFRPIAPRLAPGGNGGSNSGPPPEDGRMRRASTACKECQRRRTRCSGVPCTECLAHGRECVFDESSDRRRKASARRTQEELMGLRDFVDQMLAVLRYSTYPGIEHLLHTIRSGASQDDIRATVSHLLAQIPNPPVPDAQNPEMDPNIMSRAMGNFFDPR